jgi:hypothetical protein
MSSKPGLSREDPEEDADGDFHPRSFLRITVVLTPIISTALLLWWWLD